MTIITLTDDKDMYALEADGHAATEALCASVSTLIQTLDTTLQAFEALVTEREIRPGYAKLAFGGNGCDYLFAFLTLGCKRLAKTAPESIQVQVISSREDGARELI